MTSIEWSKVKQRLSDKEQDLCRSLSGMDGPADQLCDEEEPADFRRDGCNYKFTDRGRAIEQIREIQDQRKSLRPGHRR